MKRILIALFCFLPLTVWAQAVTTIPAEYPSLYKGVRQLGMGNAGIAMKGMDEAAPYYNPAAIPDYEKKLHFRFISPAVDFSVATIGLTKDVFDLANDLNDQSGDTGAQTDTFKAFVDKHIGEFHTIQLRLPLVTVMHHWFYFSTLLDSRSTFSFRNRAFTNVEILSRSDGGGVIGGGYSFFDDRLQAGLNLKVLHRLLIDKVVTTSAIVTNPTFGDVIDLQQGTGVGVDLGVKGQIPTWDLKVLEFLKPTAGFTWQDIGNTRFGDAGRTQQSISFGAAVHPPTFEFLKRDWTSDFALDIREINQPSTFPKKLFFGYELGGPKFGIVRPSFRVGANQLYFAGGFGLDFKYAKLEFATYGEETGLATRVKQSRRLATNLSFGF